VGFARSGFFFGRGRLSADLFNETPPAELLPIAAAVAARAALLFRRLAAAGVSPPLYIFFMYFG